MGVTNPGGDFTLKGWVLFGGAGLLILIVMIGALWVLAQRWMNRRRMYERVNEAGSLSELVKAQDADDDAVPLQNMDAPVPLQEEEDYDDDDDLLPPEPPAEVPVIVQEDVEDLAPVPMNALPRNKIKKTTKKKTRVLPGNH